jgi:curved DNA-binding protein
MQYKDYYQTLGVAKTATQDEVRKAFRKLARQYHPDVAKDKKGAEAKFKDINEAYEVLGDAEKRKQYDELGADWQSGGMPRGGGYRTHGGGTGADPFAGGHFAGTGFSDFFEQFFGAAGRRGRGGAGGFGGFEMPEANEGVDIEADLLVTIEEALHGAKKKISFRRAEGAKVETYEVAIPRGVRAGQKIRLAGQGGGPRGRAGDLYLRVKFAQHPDYRVEGGDLIHELELPVAQAVLGGEFEVPTPDGSVRLKIPPGTQPGRKFRVKGRGLRTGVDTRGDYYVEVQVELPTTLTAEARALWEKLAKLG